MRSENKESEKGAEEVEDDMLAVCLSLSSEGGGTDGEEDVVASDGGHMEEGTAGSRRMRDSTTASSLMHLLSFAILRVCNEPLDSLLLSSEGAGMVEMVEVVGSGQQDTRDNADAPSLILLLSVAVLCVRDKPLGLSLLIPEGMGRDKKEDGAAGEVEEGSSGQQIMRDDMVVSPLMPLLSASVLCFRNKLLSSSLLCSESMRRQAGCMRWRDSQEGQGQSTRDKTDTLSLVLLLSALVVHVHNEPPGLSLLRSEGMGRDWVEDGVRRGSGRVKESRSGQQ